LSLLLVGALCLVAPAGRAYANCDGPIFHGVTSSFEQCGPSAVAFAWFHGRGVQRIIQNSNNAATVGIWGSDSGILQTQADNMLVDGPTPGGASAGSYTGNTDFNNLGYDGCIKNITDGACKCATGCTPGAVDFGVLDFAIGGVEAAAPNIGKVA